MVGVLACPSKLLPGERGAFELFGSHPDFVPAPGAPEDPSLPYRADLMSGDLHIGTGQARGDGLLVREVGRDASRNQLRVKVSNNSVARYSQITVCAVVRGSDGDIEVARADGPPMPASLFPGESIELDLHFFELGDGTVRFHALGLWDAPYADCCPVNGPSTWTSVQNDSFSVILPPGWAYEPRQGIDSFVGAYVGDGVELTFDYGIYSDPLNYEDNASYNVHEETIGGLTAKIVMPTSADGITGVHFADVGKFAFPGDNIAFDVRLTVAGNGLTQEQQQIALQIFRSIRFAP
jgi:hypothetical protein